MHDISLGFHQRCILLAYYSVGSAPHHLRSSLPEPAHTPLEDRLGGLLVEAVIGRLGKRSGQTVVCSGGDLWEGLCPAPVAAPTVQIDHSPDYRPVGLEDPLGVVPYKISGLKPA